MILKLALEPGEIDENGIPMCTVVADGQWCKRSYKTKYDALSGVVRIHFVICLVLNIRPNIYRYKIFIFLLRLLSLDTEQKKYCS